MTSAAEALDVGCLHNRSINGIRPLLASFLGCFFFNGLGMWLGYYKSVLSLLTLQMFHLAMKQGGGGGGGTLQAIKTWKWDGECSYCSIFVPSVLVYDAQSLHTTFIKACRGGFIAIKHLISRWISNGRASPHPELAAWVMLML